MDPNRCPICARLTLRTVCTRCNEPTVEPTPNPDNPCRYCDELPFCADASSFAIKCQLNGDEPCHSPLNPPTVIIAARPPAVWRLWQPKGD